MKSHRKSRQKAWSVGQWQEDDNLKETGGGGVPPVSAGRLSRPGRGCFSESLLL